VKKVSLLFFDKTLAFRPLKQTDRRSVYIWGTIFNFFRPRLGQAGCGSTNFKHFYGLIRLTGIDRFHSKKVCPVISNGASLTKAN